MSDNQRGKKLAYFLKQLDEAALAGLQEYLRSPLFANSNQMVEMLSACLQNMDGNNLDLEQIHTALFPSKKWDSKRSKYLQLRLAQLLNHLLDYHALLRYQEDEQARFLYRLDAAIEENWDSYIPFMYTQTRRQLPEAHGGAKAMVEMRLETRYNSYLTGIAVSGSDTHLEQVHETLDDYFLLQKLKYATASANLALGTGEYKEDPLLDLILGYVDAMPDTERGLLLKAYANARYMIRYATTQGEAAADLDFVQLKEFLAEEYPIAKAELLDLHTYALNFCTIRIHQGEASYIAETKWLYDRILERGLLLEGEKMRAGYYKNIVTIMCRFREFDWAESFVEEYREKITSDPDQLAYLYNKAVLAFHRKDFAATVRMLYHRIHEFSDVLFGIGARNYLCRALWNQSEYRWLGSNLAAFRVYLKRQRDLSETDKRIHLMYVKYFEQILNAHTTNPDRSRQKLETIRERLNESGEGAVFQSLRTILSDLLD
jgi:hypothetical protein